MNLIVAKQHNCLAACAAMLLDITEDDIINDVGHDGLEVVRPNLPIPYCYRSYHMQELITYCFIPRGYGLVPIFLDVIVYSIKDPEHREHTIGTQQYWHDILTKNILPSNKALILTHDHAVASNGTTVLDPRGYYRTIFDYNIKSAWILSEIKSN